MISDVLVNGQSVGAVAEYTFCDVNADANITALFQKAAVSTDKSQLTAVIKEAEERLEQADKYTEETVKALQKEVEAAQFILADKEASQADIDTAVQKVRTAIDALEEKTQTEKPENPDNNKPITTNREMETMADKTITETAISLQHRNRQLVLQTKQ